MSTFLPPRYICQTNTLLTILNNISKHAILLRTLRYYLTLSIVANIEQFVIYMSFLS